MVKEKLVLRKEIRKLFRKLLYTIILFLVGMILIKHNPSLKQKINNIIYEESPSYLKIRKLYNKYFSNIKKEDTKPVFTEKLSYSKEEPYKNGVKLTVSNKYLVPILESGIIVYKDDNKITISQVNGVVVEYSNINSNNYKLYDYIEKGKLLGETKTNELYLTFEKEGKYLDYKKYI